MVTIYLDKQVFSHLFNAKDEKYCRLREKILSHKDEFIFFYSDGHLFDLQNDKSDKKFAEMEFIQSIVEGNYLIYKDFEQVVLKQSPCESFTTIGIIGDFSWLENIDFLQLTEEQRNVINNIVDISVKDFKGELDFDWLVTRIPISVDRTLVDKSTFVSIMQFISYNFYKNKESYKKLRDNIIARYNPTLIAAESENVFDEQLASSPIGLSFLSVVKAVLTQTGLSFTNSALIYYVSYILLDLFGINKEARKKVKFRNMQVDYIHSFFGSYCDCIVSDDEGLRCKSRTLYKLFNFSTKIYSIDEFIEKFDVAIANNRKNIREYFSEIMDDYIAKQVIKTEVRPDSILSFLSVSHEYFGYFNYMVEMKTKDGMTILLHKNNDFNRKILVKEIEIVVNRLVKAFNDLGANWAKFDESVEFPLLKSDKWNRFLILNDADVGITKFEGTPMLCLWVQLKHPIL